MSTEAVEANLDRLSPVEGGLHLQVHEWLTFVHNFGQLDVSLLIRRIRTDEELVDALDVVLLSQEKSSQKYTALRNFCIDYLGAGNKELSHSYRDPAPFSRLPALGAPTRPSPYGVPESMLVDVFAQGDRKKWNPNRLRIISYSELLEGSLSFGDGQVHFTRFTDKAVLLTSLWGRPLPDFGVAREKMQTCRCSFVEVTTQRLWEFPLSTFLYDAVPLCVPGAPHSSFAVRIPQIGVKNAIQVFTEGWAYLP